MFYSMFCDSQLFNFEKNFFNFQSKRNNLQDEIFHTKRVLHEINNAIGDVSCRMNISLALRCAMEQFDFNSIGNTIRVEHADCN